MSLEIRPITIDEAVAYRRAVRAGFLSAETVDDPQWAVDAADPIDRTIATFDGPDIVASLASFPTELTLPGGVTVPAGAVTAVTCRATHRRRGLLTQMITRDLTASRERGEVADVLIAAEYPIYGRFGYGPAVYGSTWELDASAASFATPGEGTIQFIDQATFRKEAPAVFDRVRVERPGMIGRSALDWDVKADIRRHPEDKAWHGFRLLCLDAAGAVQGYANYTIEDKWQDMRPRNTVKLVELVGTTPAVEARLWRFLAELDLVTTVTAGDRPTDEVLPFLLRDGRVAKRTATSDFVWVRPLDVERLLTTRSYATAGRVVLEVDDPLGLAGGRFALDAAPEGAVCSPTTATAEITIPVRTLGAASLGGVALTTLHRAGWLDEHVPGAVERASVLLHSTVTPWCNTWF